MLHTINIYNLDWDWRSYDINYPNYLNYELRRPIFLKEILDFVSKIKEIMGLDYVRGDFYETSDKLYLGKLTFHPGGGVEPFDSYERDV